MKHAENECDKGPEMYSEPAMNLLMLSYGAMSVSMVAFLLNVWNARSDRT